MELIEVKGITDINEGDTLIITGDTLKNMDIPKEHQLVCGGCGKTLDMRDASILCNGWIENGNSVCYEDSQIEYSSSIKVGSPEEHLKNGTTLKLN